jgi:hypothetical protein
MVIKAISVIRIIRKNMISWNSRVIRIIRDVRFLKSLFPRERLFAPSFPTIISARRLI